MLHSLQGYFIRPGDSLVPILYRVESLRDGKSYSIRSISAIQHGNPIFCTMLSFHGSEEGAFDHQVAMPDVPSPEQLTIEKPSKQSVLAEMPERIRRWYYPDRRMALVGPPIELRPVEMDPYIGRKIRDARINYWIKPAKKLSDDPALHRCALAYASDWSLLNAVVAPYGRALSGGRILTVSLDHSMWFHRPFRANDRLLYAKDSPSSHGDRGLARGLIFKRNGTLSGVGHPGSYHARMTLIFTRNSSAM